MLYGIEESIHEQEQGPFFVRTINTFTGKPEMVEVSKEVYQVYRRTGWNMEDNDESFYAHEVQFSSMSRDEDIDVDSFHEFVNYEANPEVQFLRCETIKVLREVVCLLPTEDQTFIKRMFEECMTEASLADVLGVSQQAVNRRKQRLLKKLKKMLEERL